MNQNKAQICSTKQYNFSFPPPVKILVPRPFTEYMRTVQETWRCLYARRYNHKRADVQVRLFPCFERSLTRRNSLRKRPRMYLSRLLHVKPLGNSRQGWLYICKVLQLRPSCIEFRKEYISTSLATIDQALLDRVENEWRRVLGNVQHYGNAIFVLGPMGAGKTTAIENRFKTHRHFRHYAYVDTDEIMGSIDKFTADKVDQYYPLARKIAIKLTDWILGEKISFVAEGTCVKYGELIEYMARLKNSGYKIHVNRLPAVSLDVILRRSKHRKNRIIPDDVVASIYENANLGLRELYEHNKGVNYMLFDDLDLSLTDNFGNDKRNVKPLCA